MAESYVVAREPAAGPRLSAAAAAAAAVPHQPQSSVVADHRPPAVSQRTRRGGDSAAAWAQQQEQVQRTRRREALEQEVAELKQQLSNEQTVHRILERALHQQPPAASSSSSSSTTSSSSAVLSSIPAFIPTKAKELLAELLLVEEEIARLEDQIQTMKKHTMLSGGIPPRRLCPSAADDNKNNHPQPQPPTPPPEFKSMFFISQAMAMDGDYDLNNKHHHQHASKSPKAAAMMSGSPKKKNGNDIGFALPPHQPRHSLDKQQQQQQATSKKILLHELPIIVSKTKSTDNKNTKNSGSRAPDQQEHPNKLSEKILKCLVCIFIRMLRSSRLAGDLDTRSGNLAAGSFSFSFRIDTSLNVAKHHDYKPGQQDHYGIFSIDDAIVRDIGPYKNLVSFTSAALDLRGFSSSPLLTKLRDMLQALQRVDLRSLTHSHKLAFWLNVYNTCIMHGILQHGLPSNSDKLLALKNKATINVSGQKFNALVIENFILRQPSSVKQEFWKCDVDVEEQQVRELYGLKSSEPNILFALCCGIRSSPALRIYKADRVSVDLEKAKLEYLQASLVVTSTRRLLIPSLIHSNMHDFAKDMESLLRWICEQLPTSWSLRKSMVDCLRAGGHHHFKMEEVVGVIPFDYDFQYLLPSM